MASLGLCSRSRGREVAGCWLLWATFIDVDIEYLLHRYCISFLLLAQPVPTTEVGLPRVSEASRLPEGAGPLQYIHFFHSGIVHYSIQVLASNTSFIAPPARCILQSTLRNLSFPPTPLFCDATYNNRNSNSGYRPGGGWPAARMR